MKKIAFYSLLLSAFAVLSACEMFEVDNYDAPDQTLRGEVVDVLTGEPVLTEQSNEGIRLRLIESSWDPALRDPGKDVRVNCRPDGTFQHTKLFKATYTVLPEGPFIPLLRRSYADNEAGRTVLAADYKTVKLNGKEEFLQFKVQPFLKVEFVGDPTTSNGKINALVRVTRAVSEADFRAAIEPTMGGGSPYSSGLLNVTDIQLFVSYSTSVGQRTRENLWSSKIEYAGSAFNPLLGQPVFIQSNGVIPSGRTVYVRAAARIDYATGSDPNTKRYNYSQVMEVTL
ncbi:MAG: DUF3823 domain-containing protein [Rikenellaceae bacterium]|nr:DUF3823 domain-containing protein [Rikenellaceae bacterium]